MPDIGVGSKLKCSGHAVLLSGHAACAAKRGGKKNNFGGGEFFKVVQL